VTPAHDPNDFELGKRHNLPNINVMDETAHINAEGGVYEGLDRYVARKRIVADLEEQGLLAGVKDHTNNIGHCDRCKTVVEPRLSTQWFVQIQPLADKAIEAVNTGAIKFTPEMYKKTYLNWMENIYDWCISRQLWWGHRIPAWHCGTCGKITVARVDPTACAHCGSAQLTQETDVLDTWFSSGLLPVSVFGWPNITAENRADFDAFYPTSLLVTGFDILFFWVARMIMLGIWFAKDIPEKDGSSRSLANSVPFRQVYIHALVRDANREKMSKTKGNVIDPIGIVKEYGTDAVRFTLASMASPGTDIAFNIARTEGYRAFANKIWNAARFIFMNVDRAAEIGIAVDPDIMGRMPFVSNDSPIEEHWIVAELYKCAAEVNQSLEIYRFDDAANNVYQFFWGSFCDWYLEIVKLRLDFSETANREKIKTALATLLSVFEASLRLLSPFMPFITEELWHAVYDGNPPVRSVALTFFPTSSDEAYERAMGGIGFDTKPVQMFYFQNLIGEIRNARKEAQVPEKEAVPVALYAHPKVRTALAENLDIIQKLARVADIKLLETEPQGSDVFTYLGFFSGKVVYERTIDVPAERERHTKDIAKYEKGVAAAERQLGNESFVQKAPPHIVEGLKKQEAETRLLLEKARAALDALPKE
jgi:valyl-tRNA synthetase